MMAHGNEETITANYISTYIYKNRERERGTIFLSLLMLGVGDLLISQDNAE